MSLGFIRDKLEIKFLILYIMSRVSEPILLAELQELTMCDDGIDYFDFAECLNDLVNTEHLLVTDEQYYCITVKGLRNSEICESSIPYSVRMRASKKLVEYQKILSRRNQVQSRVIEKENGSYMVTLSLRDDIDSIMKLELTVAAEDMAKSLADRFKKNPEQIFSGILTVLYSKENIET